MRYIDTSALVKYYGNQETEAGIDKITEIIKKAKSGKEILITSIFTIGEIISVFDKWVRQKIISEQELIKIISKFLTDINELIEAQCLILQNIDTFTTIFSTELIIKHHIPINDAIHLYTAIKSIPKVTGFISSDKLLNEAARKENLLVFDPEE